MIVEKRPELADAALTTSIAKTATTDPKEYVRYPAQQTLGVIVEKRPELADAALSVAKSPPQTRMSMSAKRRNRPSA